jgi:hypothetical protein
MAWSPWDGGEIGNESDAHPRRVATEIDRPANRQMRRKAESLIMASLSKGIIAHSGREVGISRVLGETLKWWRRDVS